MIAKAPAQKATPEIEMPPQNLVAERSVLGSLLLDNNCFDDVCEIIKPEHFHSDVHADVYRVIHELIDNGIAADTLTVTEKLDSLGILAGVGGPAFMLELLEAVPHAAHAVYYAQIVFDNWMERTLQGTCQDTLRSIRDGGKSADDLLDEHETALFRLADLRQASNQELSISDVLEMTLASINDRASNSGKLPGLSSGISSLDAMTNGFQPTTLTILAARPSMGKTAYVCNLADAFARNGVPTLIFSLEQSKLELAERLIVIRSRVDGNKVKKGIFEKDERHAILEAASEMSHEKKIWIDDNSTRSVSQVRAICRRMKRKHGLGVVIIDYLQLLEPEDKKAPREQQVAAMSRRLKGLAKDLNIPIICLSQLNRGVETREDKRPKLSDLRESGAIEQDADMVMFLHRPDAYNPDDRPGLAELVVAKHRSGPIGIVNMTWRKEVMRFQDGYGDSQEKF